MTACASAAAWLSYIRSSGFVLCMLFLWTRTFAKHTYSCLELLDMGMQQEEAVSTAFHCTRSIPPNIGRLPGSVWIVNGPDRRRRRRRLERPAGGTTTRASLTKLVPHKCEIHGAENARTGALCWWKSLRPELQLHDNKIIIRKNLIYPEGNSFVRMSGQQEGKRKKTTTIVKIKIIVTDTAVFKI